MNAVLFVDGTSNFYHDGANERLNTNVARLYDRVRETQNQTAGYLAGVGAEYDESDYVDWAHALANLPKQVREGLAQVAGFGTSIRIRKAYRALCEAYDAGNSNVYLFGFSRGAFAIRALVGFVDAVGLLLADEATIEHVELAFLLYCTSRDAEQSLLKEFLYEMTGKAQPAEDQQLHVYFVGVWDTVGAIGIPGGVGELSSTALGDLKAVLPANVSHARHALSLHDLRSFFRPMLWRGTHPDNPRQDLKQVWFPGSHSDVGGGYQECALSETVLEWMVEEARAAGLMVGEPRVYASADGPKLHTGLEKPFERVPAHARGHLKEWPALAPDLRNTWQVHPSALTRFLQPPSLLYEDYQERVRRHLREVDTSTLQLHFELCYQGEAAFLYRRPEWIRDVTVEDMALVAPHARSYIEKFDQEQNVHAFVRVFVLWVLASWGAAVAALEHLIRETNDQVLLLNDKADLSHITATVTWVRRCQSLEENLRQAADQLPAKWHDLVSVLADNVARIVSDLKKTDTWTASFYTLRAPTKALTPARPAKKRVNH